MTYGRQHNHPLDDKLHEDCPMCEEIVRRRGGVERDRQAEQALDRHARKAAKTKEAVEEIRQEKRRER